MLVLCINALTSKVHKCICFSLLGGGDSKPTEKPNTTKTNKIRFSHILPWSRVVLSAANIFSYICNYYFITAGLVLHIYLIMCIFVRKAWKHSFSYAENATIWQKTARHCLGACIVQRPRVLSPVAAWSIHRRFFEASRANAGWIHRQANMAAYSAYAHNVRASTIAGWLQTKLRI